MGITIRRADSQDLDELAHLFESIVQNLTYYNDIARANEIARYGSQNLAEKINGDPDSVIIAVDGEIIVGFCLSRIDDGLIWLEWFAVSDRYRKNGIARSLIKYLERTMPNRSTHKIWCDCRTENIKSIRLLSSEGFLPICTLKNHWYGQDFILWQKEIKL